MDYYPPSGQKTLLILTVEDILHSLYGLLLHVGEDVRVGVEGYGDGRVPEHLLNDLGVYTFGKKQGSTGVPEIVKPGALGQTGLP